MNTDLENIMLTVALLSLCFNTFTLYNPHKNIQYDNSCPVP